MQCLTGLCQASQRHWIWIWNSLPYFILPDKTKQDIAPRHPSEYEISLPYFTTQNTTMPYISVLCNTPHNEYEFTSQENINLIGFALHWIVLPCVDLPFLELLWFDLGCLVCNKFNLNDYLNFVLALPKPTMLHNTVFYYIIQDKYKRRK